MSPPLLLLALLALGVHALATSEAGAWKLLYQNDGDWSRAASASTRQAGYMLHAGCVGGADVAATCLTVGESPAAIDYPLELGLRKQLQYLLHDGSYHSGQAFWVQSHSNTSSRCTAVVARKGAVTLASRACSHAYPVLCTQSAPRFTSNEADSNATLSVTARGLTALRDAFSFRFIQVPYANKPTRFSPSSVYEPMPGVPAPGQSPYCAQNGGLANKSSEDCLVANVYTPVVAAHSKHTLAPLPILLFIHGGGFTTGTGLDPVFDGGSLASRGDVVVVTPNYRLGTLGFLSINDEAPGNWALSDLLTALRWVRKHAATFGGDARRITIVGQSAGAQLVSTLIASPAARGLFHAAIVMSGRPADAVNQLMPAAVAQAGPSAATVRSLGCADAPDVLACLRTLPVDKILSSAMFSKSVVDGHLITQPNVDVAQRRGGHVNHVPVLMGFMRDEAASLGYAPPLTQTNLDAALAAGGISAYNRSVVLSNTALFPLDGAANAVQNLTVTVETDSTSICRCGQEATIMSAATTGVFAGLWAYTQDQRAYQIAGYDPYGVCSSAPGASPTDGYYFCHSGDLLPLFNTAGYSANKTVRDTDDIVHSTLMMDFWTAFARNGDPNPPKSYLAVRGYTTVAHRLAHHTWSPVTPSCPKILSIGPSPRLKDLAIRGEQCSALGLPIDYVSQGR